MVMLVFVVVMMMLMLIVVMVVVMVGVLRLVGLVLLADALEQLVRQRDFFNGGEDGFPIQLIPSGGEDSGIGIFLPQHGHRRVQLFSGQLLRPGEDDGPGGFHLIVVKLAKVFHVDLHLGRVRHGDKAVQHHLRSFLDGVLYGGNHVAQLAHAGGFNQNAVGVKLLLHILERLVEIAYQRAANAPGGHLGDLHAGIFQESAVNGDLTKFVLNQHQLFALIGFRQQLFDERCFPSSKKAGNNVDLCHGIKSFAFKF